MSRLGKILGLAWIVVTAEAILDARSDGKNKLHHSTAKGTVPVYFIIGFLVSYKTVRKIPLMPRVGAAMISLPIGIVSVIAHIVGLITLTSHLGFVDLDELGIVENEEKLDVDIQNNRFGTNTTENDVDVEPVDNIDTDDDDDDDDDEEDGASFVEE